jgi:hypothetical protein
MVEVTFSAAESSAMNALRGIFTGIFSLSSTPPLKKGMTNSLALRLYLLSLSLSLSMTLC